MSTDFEVKGMDEIMAKLQQKLGPERVDRVVSKALRSSADNSVKRLSSDLAAAYYNTGISSDGVTHGSVSRASGVPIVKIGNSGEHWSLIHLNEFGYTRNGKSYSGAGHGVLRAFVAKEGQVFRKEVESNLRELIE